MPAERRREWLVSTLSASAVLQEAGMKWSDLDGWLQGPMDAAAWQAVIPSMGYMALLRNLRNFDAAGVPDEVAQRVARRLADPEQVAKSKQLPIRFYTAFKATKSLRWAWALERAVNASLANVPRLGGRTLILVDCSNSMTPSWSGTDRNGLSRAEYAGL
ncbi:MAG TPA: TROVE domain-containing protein, partial [Streptosporangiaceae bacterium]